MSAPLPRQPVQCVICGEWFFRPGNQNKITCSSECARKRENERNRAYTARDSALMERVTATCAMCGAEFEKLAKTNRKTCSEQCSVELRNIRNTVAINSETTSTKFVTKCKWCGKQFYRVTNNQVICSIECYRAYDAARKRATRPSRAKPKPAKPKPEPIAFTHMRPYIRCIRSNDLYAAGMEYERGMVIKDIRAGEVAHQDFAL